MIYRICKSVSISVFAMCQWTNLKSKKRKIKVKGKKKNIKKSKYLNHKKGIIQCFSLTAGMNKKIKTILPKWEFKVFR